jgi:aminoglycoside 6'-N-acetyltransferase I
MTFELRRAHYPGDEEQLLDLWMALYTWATSREAERESMRDWFARTDAATFVAFDPADPSRLLGYADVGERSIADGCETSPVAYLEAWYVISERRKQGIGEALIRAVEAWAQEHEYQELASDALLENTLSHRLHKKFGFEETDRVVQFKKRLSS